MYGAQTATNHCFIAHQFENDVEMYGAQTVKNFVSALDLFENDVEMYGAQTVALSTRIAYIV